MRFLRFILPVLFVATVYTNPSAAQTAPILNPPSADVIDGAVHPELISDDLALSVWLLAVGEPSGASSEASIRMQAKLGAVALQATDRDVLSKLVVHFADVRESFRQREQGFADSQTSLGEQQRQQLSSDRMALFTQTKSAIANTLSAQGQIAFAQHLLRVKQHMRVGSGPQM